MKKNGFIMSTYVYILLVFFLLLLGTMLVVLNNTRLLANKIKDNKNVNVDFNLILKGDKEIILKKDSEYIEPGYIATTFDGKKLDVNVMGEVNVNKLGEYDIIYIAEYKGVEKKIRRKVIVAENLDACTTGIEIWAPIPDEPPEPSEDNSKYEICGKEGIKIVIGKTKVLHPNYIPSNATNRNVTWSTSDESIVSIKASNPNNNTGYSRATITANKLGTIIITAETTLKQKATCKVEVIKDTIDSIGCSVSPRSIMTGSTGVIIPTYTPSNATNYNFEYSVSASSFVAEQAGYNTIRANYNGGSGSVTIKDTVSGKTGTCYFDVYEPAPDPDPGPSCTYFSCNLCEASTGKSCQMVNGCCEPVSSSGGSSGGNKCDYLSSGHCIGATGQSCTLDSNGCYVPNGPAYVNPPASGGGGAGCAHLKDIGMPCTKYQLN